jgi:hypothetical protein
MERRFDWIRDHLERATKRQVHEKKSQLHHNLEAGKTEAIVKIIIVGMGMSNHQRIITQL